MTSFQVQLRGQWQDYGNREDLLLKMALIAGRTSIVLAMNGDSYECNFDRMIQVNLRTGNERKMRAPVVHESKECAEQSSESSEAVPSTVTPRRHSAPAIADCTIMPPVAGVACGAAATTPAFRRQGHTGEERMLDLLSVSEKMPSVPIRRHSSSYPGGFLQYAKKAVSDRAKLFVGQRNRKHKKELRTDRPDKCLATMDTSFEVLEDSSCDTLEDLLQDAGLSILL
jgi:hypothetical protein